MEYRTAEHLGAAWYSARGFRINYPASDVSSYDLIIKKPNSKTKALCVNVKVARRHGKKWRVTVGEDYDYDGCDKWLLWTFNYSFFEIDISSIENRNQTVHTFVGSPEPILYYSDR